MARTKPSLRPRPACVGETRAAADFFAGRYAKVAASTFDGPSMVVEDADVAFAVGALTFLAREADAIACFEAWRERSPGPEARTMAASRFFLGVAAARAGDFGRARVHLVDDVRERIRDADAWSASFVFQGLACYRYFTGRYRAAARHAARALRTAVAAKLAWVQMLANDLRGHALVQLGLFHAGTALLDRARMHATRLGLGDNAFAIACSIAIYRAKIKLGPDALGDLEALLARRAHDSYSRRMLLTQAAVQYALRGRCTEARAALAEADRDALEVDARRAKVGTLLARLHVERFARGVQTCADLLDQATALTAEGDVAFRAELHAFQLWVGRALGDREREARAREALEALRSRSEHHAITTALADLDPERPRAFAEDEIAPLLRSAASHDLRALGRMLGQGIAGPIPETCGLAPGRRILWLASENALVVEDHGDVFVRPSPPRWVDPLLRVLGSGSASKARIVAELWGLRRYVPDRHDSLIRTTIHRLRTWLEPRGSWVVVTGEGYGLTVGVHVVGAAAAPTHQDVAFLDAEALDAAPPLGPVVVAPNTREASDPLVNALAEGAPLSVPEIARATALSASTVLRGLRALVKSKRVVRTGYARATRYRLR